MNNNSPFSWDVTNHLSAYMMRCYYAVSVQAWYIGLIFKEISVKISVFLFGIMDSCTIPMFGCHWIVTLIKGTQYVAQDRLVKQLQFYCEKAFPAALTIFIKSGDAGGPLAITGDGTLLSHSQPNSVIRSDEALMLENVLAACAGADFHQWEAAIHKGCFTLLLNINHILGCIHAGALWLTIKCS